MNSKDTLAAAAGSLALAFASSASPAAPDSPLGDCHVKWELGVPFTASGNDRLDGGVVVCADGTSISGQTGERYDSQTGESYGRNQETIVYPPKVFHPRRGM